MSAASKSESHAERLVDLDRRHDELIDEIEALNTRIEAALAELLPPATDAVPDAPIC